MPKVRVIEFTLQCKVTEDSNGDITRDTTVAVNDELKKALKALQKQEKPSSNVVTPMEDPSKNDEGIEKQIKDYISAKEGVMSSRSETGSQHDVEDTVISSVMFVYEEDRKYYLTKQRKETGVRHTLKEIIEATAYKADLTLTKFRIFKCDRHWVNLQEIDMREHETNTVMEYVYDKLDDPRVYFVVDMINTSVQKNRPTPYDMQLSRKIKDQS